MKAFADKLAEYYWESFNGEDYHLFTLQNNDFKIRISDYGGTIVNWFYHDIDIVQGFEHIQGYVSDVKYMNAIIGRVCNRIGKGTFQLNGQTYHLFINNGPNTLHGGKDGFDVKKWTVEAYDQEHLVLTYLSKDLEEGFPGNLKVKVIYTLKADGLDFAYAAQSDQDTIVNITNHAFFNLNGPLSTTILDDSLMINADQIAKIDKDGLALEELMAVQDTPFDFKQRKKIGRDIKADHEQIVKGNGYDHHFIINGEGYRRFCTYDNGKLSLTIYSDLPGMQLYSANFLDGTSKGKEGGTYPQRSSICFETQYHPDAINMQNVKKPLLKAGEIMTHHTFYQLKELDK